MLATGILMPVTDILLSVTGVIDARYWYSVIGSGHWLNARYQWLLLVMGKCYRWWVISNPIRVTGVMPVTNSNLCPLPIRLSHVVIQIWYVVGLPLGLDVWACILLLHAFSKYFLGFFSALIVIISLGSNRFVKITKSA